MLSIGYLVTENKPDSSFRSTYAYQNVTYLVAGEIIKAITDTTWDDFVTQHIFEPLGMQRTTTKLSDLNRLQNYAIPHAWINGRIQSIPYRNHENVGAAAAVNSSVWDWAQYVQMFLNQGEYHGRTIISPQRVKELWTPQTIIPVEPLQPALQKLTPMLNAYGMGWFISDYCGHLIIAHSGGVDGMRTQMSIVPEKMMGFVIFTNIEPGYALSALYYSVLDQILGLEETPWSDIYAKIQTESFQKKADLLNERRQSRKENTTTSLALNHYCGDYHDPKTGLISVYQTGNKLRLSFEHSKCFHAELRHWHQDTFEIVWDDTYIPVGLLTFMINHDGIPDRIQLDQPNLLDVDFTELEIVRFHQKFGRQES
ncbi:MAG: hypothetical protein CVU41_03390 [Chloroflexi bacterium HGW-Chloroflexi-3]|nr:MAG: hypothetical protein CVU41_03390 [Chloroflexi bacterium HGW-Chloroflexi-3]